MNKNKKRIAGVIALITAVSVASVALFMNVTDVLAAKSVFSGVEDIRNQNSSSNVFEILEVAPDEGMGSIGYYVKDSEPYIATVSGLSLASDRYNYMQKLQTLMMNERGVMGVSGDTAFPLETTKYQEMYEGTVEDSVFSDALDSGDWKELQRRTGLSEDGAPTQISPNQIPENTVSIDTVSTNTMLNYKMSVSMNENDEPIGMFTPFYEPVQYDISGNAISNPAREFFYENNQDFVIATSLDGKSAEGLFDPHLVLQGIDGSKHYQATFQAVNGAVGYVAGDATGIKEGDAYNADWLIGTPLYQMEDGAFVLKATLDCDNNQKVKIVPVSSKYEVSMVTPLDGEEAGNETTGVRSNQVEESEPVANESTVSEGAVVSTLDGEILADEAPEDLITGTDEDTYYMMLFAYDTDASLTDRVHYQVASMTYDDTFYAPYYIDDAMPLVPNGRGTGLINPDFSVVDPMTIVYHYHADWGVYAPEEETDAQTAISGSRILFQGGMTNHEWFKQFVFGLEESELSNSYVHVTTISANALEDYDLSQTDLLYLSDSKGEFLPDVSEYDYEPYEISANDISRSRALDILSMVTEERYPVMIDASLMGGDTNLSMLAQMLDLADPSLFVTDHAGESEEELASVTISENAMQDDDKNFVNDSIYIFNENAVNGVFLLNQGFDTGYGDSFIEDGFTEVVKEIKTENILIDEENKINDTQKDKLDTKISEAVAIQYILSAISRRGILGKDEIHVLELQPMNYNSSDCTVDTTRNDQSETLYTLTIKDKNGTYQNIIEDCAQPIKVTTMSTSEFIGKTEDINSKYDMIYVGLNTGNGDFKMNLNSAGRTVYNDTNMNGLIYTAVGDRVYCSSDLYYLNDTAGNYYRFSGNDITESKLSDLKEYLEAGYPVLFAENFYVQNYYGNLSVYTKNNNSNFSGYIDKASYMYSFANTALTRIKNSQNAMRMQNSITDDFRETLENYIYAAKPSVEYTSEDSGIYTDAEGIRYISIYFTVNNKGTVNQSPRFKAQLYLDANADGKFSETTEIVDGCTVQDKSGNTADITNLQSGVRYHILKPISSGYAGVIAWKLEASQQANNYRRSSQSGYYMVESSEKIKINALQINTSGTKATTWNMEESLANSDSLLHKYAVDNSSVKNYDISVKTITAAEFTTQYKAGTIDLNEYGMLILGFGDCYDFPTGDDAQNAMNAIATYIKSGKSVLFTHDTTSYYNSSGHWGYQFNKTIRELVGLDRYGVTGNTTIGEKDKPFKPNYLQSYNYLVNENQGYTNWLLERYRTDDSYNQYRNYNYTNKDWGDRNTGGYDSVEQVNSGQITDYPYVISTEADPIVPKISNTHTQYYQIDLEGDADSDGENDIVVWYTLNNSYYDDGTEKTAIYKYSPKDVRNNYYVYNRGNVTYSGAGHSDIETEGNDKEVQLFVNTLISSYYAGLKTPVVSIIENKNITSNAIENINAPFDAGLWENNVSGNYIDYTETKPEATESVYFYATDTNLVKDSSLLSAKIYYESDTGTEMTLDGQTVKVAELNLSSYPIINAETEAGAEAGDLTNSARVADGKVYKVEVPVSILGKTDRKNIFVQVNDRVKRSQKAEEKDLLGNDSVSLTKLQLFDLK